MSKKESEIEEVEITLEPTLEEQYQEWRKDLDKPENYKRRKKILKKQFRPSIRDKDLRYRLEFLKATKGEVMAHIVDEALVEHFKERFKLPSKEFASVLAENKKLEIKKQLKFYEDHSGIKLSLSEALRFNWKVIGQHWRETHVDLSSVKPEIEKLKKSDATYGLKLHDILEPICSKTFQYFCLDYDYKYGIEEKKESKASVADLVNSLKLVPLSRKVEKVPQYLKDIISDVKIAEEIASHIEELIKEYRETVK